MSLVSYENKIYKTENKQKNKYNTWWIFILIGASIFFVSIHSDSFYPPLIYPFFLIIGTSLLFSKLKANKEAQRIICIIAIIFQIWFIVTILPFLLPGAPFDAGGGLGLLMALVGYPLIISSIFLGVSLINLIVSRIILFIKNNKKNN